MCKMQIAVARATQLCRPKWELSANYSARTFPCYRLLQTKNPLAIVVWKPWVTDQRWKTLGDVLHEILSKNTAPTRVTHCAFIKVPLRPLSQTFLWIPYISFSFLQERNKPTQSATITLTLWIYRTEDELQSYILVWREYQEKVRAL